MKPNTYTHEYKGWQTVVGDETEDNFYPRVKIKKWNNEANLSVGLKELGGKHSVDNGHITYETDTHKAHFYPISSEKEFDTSSIRYIKTGEIDPITIAAHYELDRHIHWPKQTIVYHIPDRYSMMYYGYYPVSDYIDKCDLPEIRVSGAIPNNPMIMDNGLPLIDVHYNPDRDDIEKINRCMEQALVDVVGKYTEVIVKGWKAYFRDGDKLVKFFSTAPIDGHYYFYINLDTDYNKAYDYYKPEVKKNIKDEYAYGLKAVCDVPDDLVDQVIRRYSELYGTPLEDSKYTDEELAIIESLRPIMESNDWIYEAKRDDIYSESALTKLDGYEFEIHLKEKPTSNVVPLSVQSKELDFFYQPFETNDPSERRPDNVKGSYAAYHKVKKHNEYETGKAFHIYRPWAVDATGKKVWCDFDPSWNGEDDLKITVPQDFLNNAVYPVIIDPTFGYTSVGASNVSITATGLYYYALLNTTGVAGNISSYSFYGNISAAVSPNDVPFAMALYNNSSQALVDSSAYNDLTTSLGVGWHAFPSNNGLVVSAIGYDIGVYLSFTVTGYNAFAMYYDTGVSGNGGTATPGSYPNPP